jgi:hypothetical protein
MKKLLTGLLMAAALSSSGPARDLNGQPWKAKQVWRRVTAGNYNPITQQVKCPQKP